ncbi:MAG: PilZ domain-containing protein [Acidobacteriia bacterium]|nr:PilZ domain-containing protein [Terriglobia bacterium]
MTEERRIVPRLSLQVPLVLVIPESGVRYDGRTRDLSSSGVFFYTDAPLEEQQEVELLMTFPSELTRSPIQVACVARVLRVEREAVAVNTGVAVAIQKFDFHAGGALDISHLPFPIG